MVDSNSTPKNHFSFRPADNGKPYTSARKAIKKSLEKHRVKLRPEIEPDMAIDVLDKTQHRVKPVEQALVTEHLFRKTIEASVPVGISAFDMEWRQIYVNRFFCEMVGFPRSKLMGKDFPQPYWPKEIVSQFTESPSGMAAAMLAPNGLEIRFRHQNGNRFWGLVQGNLLIDGQGETRGRLISVANIDHQKQIERTLKMLSTRLVNAREAERKLVSQDIHDGIGGRLAGIKYSLEKLLFDIQRQVIPTASQLEEITSQVQRAIEDAQKITRNLHPSVLDDLGLCSALQAFCREFQEIYAGIRVRAKVDLNESTLPESLKILVYRVVQEALNNVARHSGAGRVDLTVHQSDKTVALSVEDNGRGFDLNQALRDQDLSSGMGLQSMAERTELFGGTLDIQTGKGKGTRVSAIWPLSSPV